MNDRALRPVSKLDSHLASTIRAGRIHRAFSVFVFCPETHALLIQKRASTKIVFPRQWANACCSHPRYVESEMASTGGDNIGVKLAAAQRLEEELGLVRTDPRSLVFKEKILYRQISPGNVFGESECDYILMSQMPCSSQFVPNENEVERTEWIRPGPTENPTMNLREFLLEETRKGFPPTPWFDLVLQEPACLEAWWKGLIADSKKFMHEQDTCKEFIRSFL